MPKVVDHATRRAELADIALRVIARDGLRALTIRQLARESGWSTGTLVHYFGSTRELLLASLRRAAAIQGREFTALRHDRNIKPLEQLEKMIESILPLDDRRVAMTRIFLVFYTEVAGDEPTQTEISTYIQNWHRVITKVILDGQRAGDIPSGANAEKLAMALVATTDGLAMHALLHPDVLDLIRNNSLSLEFRDDRFSLSFSGWETQGTLAAEK